MNVYIHEVKSLIKSALIWSLSLVAIAALFLFIYPSIVSDAEAFKSMINVYPKSIQAMLGINLDYITSMLGFYSMIFSFVCLGGAIQAMNLGTSILSKESRERTADFLLVKPISRFNIVSRKLAAAITILVGTDMVYYLSVSLIANLVKTDDFNLKKFLLINLSMFFIQIIFLCIGMAVSVFFKKIKTVLPISIGVVFGLYIIGALFDTGKGERIARLFSPFKYFDITFIMNHSSYEVPYLILSAGIVIVAILLTYNVYIKKDIHAVS